VSVASIMNGGKHGHEPHDRLKQTAPTRRYSADA
jgi:hypothetical protein